MIPIICSGSELKPECIILNVLEKAITQYMRWCKRQSVYHWRIERKRKNEIVPALLQPTPWKDELIGEQMA
jgi:hypothetical protein